MTAFALTVPAGLEIAHAHEVEGWDESIDGSTATWLGGPLAPDAEIDFGITLEADVEPGVVELQAEQRYAGRRGRRVAGRPHDHPGRREPVAEPRARRRGRAHRRALGRGGRDARLAPPRGARR